MAEQKAPNDWQQVMAEGDEEAFRRLVEPHMDRLLRAAQHDLDYYVTQDRLREEDLTAEEIVGETLIYAWRHRDRCPTEMSLQGWLLGTQFRVLRVMVRQQEDYSSDKALSLNEPVESPNEDRDPQEWFRKWYEPEDTLESITPGNEPTDIEAPLFTNEETFELDPETRHVAIMHDEFDLPLDEVAYAMNQSIDETSSILERARERLRAGGEGATPETDRIARPGENR